MRYDERPCDQHEHSDPKPCIACCYTDNGYCVCDCHRLTFGRMSGPTKPTDVGAWRESSSNGKPAEHYHRI